MWITLYHLVFGKGAFKYCISRLSLIQDTHTHTPSQQFVDKIKGQTLQAPIEGFLKYTLILIMCFAHIMPFIWNFNHLKHIYNNLEKYFLMPNDIWWWISFPDFTICWIWISCRRSPRQIIKGKYQWVPPYLWLYHSQILIFW